MFAWFWNSIKIPSKSYKKINKSVIILACYFCLSFYRRWEAAVGRFGWVSPQRSNPLPHCARPLSRNSPKTEPSFQEPPKSDRNTRKKKSKWGFYYFYSFYLQLIWGKVYFFDRNCYRSITNRVPLGVQTTVRKLHWVLHTLTLSRTFLTSSCCLTLKS